MKQIPRHKIRGILISLYRETTGCRGKPLQVLPLIHSRLDEKNRLFLWDLLTKKQRQEVLKHSR